MAKGCVTKSVTHATFKNVFGQQSIYELPSGGGGERGGVEVDRAQQGEVLRRPKHLVYSGRRFREVNARFKGLFLWSHFAISIQGDPSP